MLTAKNLERVMELEEKLRAEYQAKLDAKTTEIEGLTKKLEERKAVIEKQLEQIISLSGEAKDNKRVEQLNRELNHRCERLEDEAATQKKRIKTLQKDLAAEREELKTLKRYDPAAMKKNLDANKKKLVEKTTANDLLQKSLSKTRGENIELQRKVEELEAKVAEPGDTEANAEDQEAAAA